MVNLWRVTVDLDGTHILGGGNSTFHFSTLGGTAQDAADAVADFYTAVGAYMATGNSWAVNGAVHEIDADTNETVGVTGVGGSSGNGSDGSGDAPPVLQGLVQWRTSIYLGGRELRGRTYIPAVTTNRIASDGSPSSTYTTALDTAGTALVTDAASLLVVYSPTYKEFAQVSTVEVWNKFAELRSRRD